jgi:hypothetical protein
MNKILIAISVFIWGFATLLNYFGVLDFSIETLTSIVMIAYGLSSTNLAYNFFNYIFIGDFVYCKIKL